MDSFKFLYLEVCDSSKIIASEKLLSIIEDAGNSTSLNLSSVNLTNDVCKAIGLAISKDIHLRELDFSNCALLDEGLLYILLGIQKNKFLLSLNLKGNNIRSVGTEALSKLLRHNNHLQSLYLEWNGIGTFPEKFAIFCESLCTNTSLKTLDLRNNKLNHICAQSISDVICRNSTLQKLDLRWNNIGLIGGRTIFRSISKNKTILNLDVAGNDIPSDILKSIEIATSIAVERFVTRNEQIERSKTLASMLRELEMEKNSEVKSLMEQLEKMEHEASVNERWNVEKLNALQEELKDKDLAYAAITLNFQELQKKYSVASEEMINLALTLNEVETKNRELKAQYQCSLNKGKKEKEEMERQLLEELGSLKEENLFLKQQVQDLKNLLAHSEGQVMKLKGTVAKLERMSKVEKSSFEEQLSLVNESHAEALRENESARRNEIVRLKDEFGGTEKNLRQRITLLEAEKFELEKVIIQKKSELESCKTHAEDMIVELKKNMKFEEDKLRQQMEKKIEILETANKKQEGLLQEHLEMMYEIRTKATALDLQLAEESHRAQCLQQCLEAKDEEMKTAVAKAKLDISNAEINLLKKQMKEMDVRHKEELKVQSEICETLRSEIKKQKNKIKDILDKEEKRKMKLQMAFASYLSPPNQMTDNEEFQAGDVQS